MESAFCKTALWYRRSIYSRFAFKKRRKPANQFGWENGRLGNLYG